MDPIGAERHRRVRACALHARRSSRTAGTARHKNVNPIRPTPTIRLRSRIAQDSISDTSQDSYSVTRLTCREPSAAGRWDVGLPDVYVAVSRVICRAQHRRLTEKKGLVRSGQHRMLDGSRASGPSSARAIEAQVSSRYFAEFDNHGAAQWQIGREARAPRPFSLFRRRPRRKIAFSHSRKCVFQYAQLLREDARTCDLGRIPHRAVLTENPSTRG